MSAPVWDPTTALPSVGTFLLEASAGTGKTYQIASLFLRLVGEYGLAIDRILAITFTNAATTELRDRVRARLRDALDQVVQGQAPADDPVLAQVRRSLAHLGEKVAPIELQRRLTLALRQFDLAPISTIHGFSQRMLRELAFESGQDGNLELMASARPLIETLADDTLATLYVRASATELGAFESAGFTREALIAVGQKMSGAVAPTVSPQVAPGRTQDDDLADVRAYLAALEDALARWRAPDAIAEALRAAHDARSVKFPTPHNLERWCRAASAWLAAGGPPLTDDDGFARQLLVAKVAASVDGAGAAISMASWGPALVAIDAAIDRATAFWASFCPLATFARDARAAIDRALAERSSLTYDAMLSRLADAVAATGGASGALATAIGQRFDAVLVDEFQDTDRAQWDVLAAAFHRRRLMFLIGDPKQAIYSFRGADVNVYLDAAEAVAPERRYTMVDNWRSDPAAVGAMNALFRADSNAFDQPSIDYVEVRARRPGRLAPTGSGLEVRWIDGRLVGQAEGTPIGRRDERALARLAAAEIVALIEGRRGRIVEDGRARAPRAGDLAVLTSSHREAATMRRALAEAGVPAVSATDDNVFASEAADALVRWLEAVDGAGRTRHARAAALSPLFGWSGEELAWSLAIADRGEPARREAEAAGVGARDWSRWTAHLAEASSLHRREGFARAFDASIGAHGVAVRLLRRPDGERLLTDLRHLFELAHAHDRQHRPTPAALARWVRDQADDEREEHRRRLESDALAVKIETIHVSKGLEYPFVLLPFASAPLRGATRGPRLLRDRGRVDLDVSPAGSELREEGDRREAVEGAREALRKTYVALTRAKHRTVVWFGPMGEAGARLSTTAIGRLLMRPPHARGFDDDAMPTIGDDPAGFAAAVERLDGLSAASGGTIGWAAEPSSALVRAPSARRALEEAPSPALTPAAWPAGRGAPRSLFRVTSYSGLVARAALFDRDEKITAMIEAEAPADGPFELEATDARAARADRSERREQGDPHDGDDEAPRAPVLSLGHGVEYGTWVHAVLEETEFTTAQAKDGRPLATLAAARAREVGLGDERAMIEELAAAMTPILRTPLDLRGAGVDDPLRIPDSFSLSRIAEGDRLDELAFDLRLGRATRGGDEPGEGRVRSAAIAHALATEGAPITEGARRWLRDERRRAERGESIVAGALGVLTGAIDLVFRIGRGDDARHYIVDYKTNRLGLGAVDDYRQSALDRAMIEHAYPLQSLLYTVALHRHLRVRLGGRYDYERHVGGLLYLFVRGMIGEQTPRDPHTGRSFGVLADRWPKALVLAFDAALDGASETRSGRWSGGARTPDSSATGATSATGAADAAERDGESER